MTLKQLQQISTSHFYCLALDRHFPKSWRSFSRKFAALGALIAFLLSFDALPLYFGWADGLFFLFLFIFLSLSFLEFFYRSLMGEGVHVRLPESLAKRERVLDYALSNILFVTDEIDITRAMFESPVGRQVLLRAGISYEDLQRFIYSDRVPAMASAIMFEGDSVNLEEYVDKLFEADRSFQSFLSSNSVNKKELLGAAAWVMRAADKRRRKERYWSKENLGTIPSIGSSWSYGVAADLGQFGLPFASSLNLSALDIENGYREREVTALEGILERRQEANAIIIDDDESIARDIVGRLSKKMKLGISFPLIEHKNIIELDSNALISSFKNKLEVEAEILKIFNQAVLAGNIIIYISDLAGLISSTKNLGASLPSLIAPYLASTQVQVIAAATNSDFHFFIETSPTLLERFERIIPDPAGTESSVAALLEQAPGVEQQYGLVFSYPAILSLVVSAERFMTYGEMPAKALDLLNEIAPWAKARNITILKEDYVNIFVSEKTGMNAGPLKAAEAQKIEDLESIVHERVIGQEEAVSAIASAMRRSRSGVNNPKRPLASFLFVGPTGVGKTEVAKALAEGFFGDEKKMIRFDMSEFNGPDALPRLIGEYAMNKSGILASKIRDNPYSVLLLDEFEKAAPDVLDLFLQILDEGIFNDALGKQVNCRNLIIIATSNAGPDLKAFKPELVNRFDGVIKFQALQNEELKNVARLGLQKLGERLKEKDLELVITDELLDFLVNLPGEGVGIAVNGRSINRAIQEKIEDVIARKIISGALKPGDKIELTNSDLK